MKLVNLTLFTGLAFANANAQTTTPIEDPLSTDWQSPKVLIKVNANDLASKKPQSCSYLLTLKLAEKPSYCSELARPSLEPTCRDIYVSSEAPAVSLHPNFVFDKGVSRSLKRTLKKNLKESGAIEGNLALKNFLGALAVSSTGFVYGSAYLGPVAGAVVGGIVLGGAAVIASENAIYKGMVFRNGKFPDFILEDSGIEVAKDLFDSFPRTQDDTFKVIPLTNLEVATYNQVFEAIEAPKNALGCPKL